MTTDKFGINKIFETIPNGREWFSKWDNGHVRTWKAVGRDPDDPESLGKGSGTFKVDGNGIMKVTGSPRIYVLDPIYDTNIALAKSWRNIEVTTYGYRVGDQKDTYGGIITYGRTNHIDQDTQPCDSRGYGTRFRYPGYIDISKETKHPSGTSTANKLYWPNGLPYGTWIGQKFIIRDMPDGNVKLESYIDEADGANGGNWVKIDEFVDNGSNFGVGEPACTTGINPALRLQQTDNRPGSETGKPNVSVYWKIVSVTTDGLWFKKSSVREIASISDQILDTILLSPANVTIDKGEDTQITPTCKDQNNNVMTCPTLTWSSSDMNIATVDSIGIVKGISAGTANIMTTSGTINSNPAVVTVTVPLPILTSILLSPTSVTINKGENTQITAICKDQNDSVMTCPSLTWISTDLNVAIVDPKGLVTGISVGTTNIIAASGIVNSNPAIVTVVSTLTSISLSPTSITINKGENAQITAICMDQNNNVMTCPTLIWVSSDANIATVDSTGLVTGISAGAANIISVSGTINSNPTVVTVNIIPSPTNILLLDGENSFVTVPDHIDLTLNSSTGMTISIMFRPDTLNFPVAISNYVYVMGKIFPNNNREYGLRMFNKDSSKPNYIYAYLFQLDKASGVFSVVKEPVSIGEWINIIYIFSSKNVYIFKNGTLKDCDAYTSGSLTDNCKDNSIRPIYPGNGKAPLRIGTAYTKSDGFSSESFFKGGVREVRMYNKTFSRIDAASLYKSVVAGTNDLYPENLVFFHNYRLGNAKDQSGRGHDGILIGNAKFGSG